MDFTDKLDILYARRSSEDGKDGESIENQIALLKQYAADKGYYNIKVITDDGYTGTNFNRPGFQEALALIQHRRVGRFIVKDLSRLGRNTVEVGKYIGVVFPRFGVEFISVHDGPESGDPDSLITQFKNIMNEYYAKDISDKQKLSLQARSNSGRHIASTPTYGYKLDPNDRYHWIIDEPAAEVVRLVFKYYNEGMQVSEIARRLENAKYPAPSYYRHRVVKGSRTEKNPYHWTSSSVTAILKRQEYVGDTVNFKTYHTSFKDKQVRYRDEESFTIIPNTQEAIISREEYEKAKKRRKSTRRVIQTREKHLLDDMVYCEDCGKKMYLNFRKYAGGNCYVYICDSYRKKKGCTAHYIQETEVITSVLYDVRRIFDMCRLDKNECRRTLVRWICQRNEREIRDINARIKTITDRLQTINQTEQALFEQKLQDEISQETFTNITVSMNAESESLKNEYGKLMILLDKFDDQKKNVPRFLTKAEAFADTEITKDDRYILEQLVEKVTIQEIEITDIYNKPATKVKVLVYFVDIGQI